MLAQTMDYLTVVATILSVAISVKPEQRGVCVFPGYVQSGPKQPWVMPHPDGQRFQAHFSGSMMIGTHPPISKSVKYERSCEERLENDKFLVSHREHQKEIRYLCMQFVKRSDSVIQLKTSNYSRFMRSYICNDQKLELDHRPLVSIKHYFHHKVHCAFQGGYNFHVYNPQGENICRQIFFPLRIESECEKGDGMTFKFRNDHCVDRSWGIDAGFEKVRCLARWQQGKNTFIVIRKIDKLRVWCMRVTKDEGGRRTAYLFFDFVCDPSEEVNLTDNYIRLEMEKKIFTSTCEDESVHCTADVGLCDSKFGPHCPLKCGRCSYDDDLNTCQFLDTIRGDWLQLSASGNRKVSVRVSDMKIQGVGNFRCIKLQAQEFLRREVLLQIFNNGCHPRYTCVDLEKVAPSVVRYRLGHSVEWPLFHVDHQKQHICGNNRFFGVRHHHKPHMKSSTIPMLSLVNRKQLRFVNCNLPRTIPDVVGFVDAEWCGGCLTYNRYFSPHTFTVSYANCTNLAPRLEYQCLASMQLKEYRGIITKTTGISKEFLCWIFDGENRIFNVLGSDCDYVTAENLRLGFEEPSAEWIVRQNASFCGPDGPINTEPEMTLPTPTKKVVTKEVIEVLPPVASSSGEQTNGARAIERSDSLLLAVILVVFTALDTSLALASAYL